MWRNPTVVPDHNGDLFQVLCRVLPDLPHDGMPRACLTSISSGDHAAGELFVSVGFPDLDHDYEAGWCVAGWNMSQDCWEAARRYEVIGWMPLAPPSVSAAPTPEFKLRSAPYKDGWYWATSEDGPMYGPFDTREEAIEDFWDNDGQALFEEHVEYGMRSVGFALGKDEWLAQYPNVTYSRRAAISVDVFDADRVLEDMEEKNEEAVWPDAPPDFVDCAAKRELEKRLATVLYEWCEKHRYWEQFRAMEPAEEPKT